uniref:RNA-directed DNA polymerase n=1 Tax=Steinernema glaseri TaxID=37863 RepID=A0A1I8ASQ7_9BILA
MCHEDYEDILHFLKCGENRREGKSARQSLQRKASKFAFKDSRLYLAESDDVKGAIPKVVVKAGEEVEILHKAHVDTAHGGRDPTLNLIKSCYYWNNLKQDVTYFISGCHSCQLNRSALKLQSNELRPIPPPKAPGIMYGIDLITLPESSRGNKYVAVAVDYFTKYPFAKAIPTKGAVEIADFIVNDIVSYFGVPKYIITDQGSEFKAALVKQMVADKLGIQQRFSAPYHPETNGLVERMNQTLKNKLRKLLEDVKNWDDHLPMALMAIRSTKNRATKKSPLELLIGYPMRMPLHVTAEEDSQDAEDPKADTFSQDSFLVSRFKKLSELNADRIQAREAILEEQAKYKAYYDRKHKPQMLRVGDLVTRINEAKIRSKGKTMETNRKGPYRVTGITRHKTILLDGLKGTHNADRLVPYKKIELPASIDELMNVDTCTSEFASNTTVLDEEDDGYFSRPCSPIPSREESIDSHAVSESVGSMSSGHRCTELDICHSIVSHTTVPAETMEPPRKILKVVRIPTNTKLANSAESTLDQMCLRFPTADWQQKHYKSFLIKGPVQLVSTCQTAQIFSELHDPVKEDTMNVRADGNCGFRVLSLFLFGYELYHGHLRRVICSWIERQPAKWIETLTASESCAKTYLTKKQMWDNAKWMSTVELQAAAEIFGIHVLVYDPSCARAWRWRKHSPDFSTSQRYRPHIDDSILDADWPAADWPAADWPAIGLTPITLNHEWAANWPGQQIGLPQRTDRRCVVEH